MPGKNKKIKAEVDQLLTKLGIPSGGTTAKGKFRKLTLILAIVQAKKGGGKGNVLSSLTLDMGQSDSVVQTLLPNGDYLMSIRIKGLA